MSKDLAPTPINRVHLLGRVSSSPRSRILPSGDEVVEFRLVIGRVRKDGRGTPVDTLDIAAWSSRARRSALALLPGSWVEIEGAVRRRFWQAPTGIASRWQVEAAGIKRIKLPRD